MANEQKSISIRWIVLTAVILLLIGLLNAGKEYFLSAIDSDWEDIGRDVNRELAGETDRHIRAFAEGLVHKLEEIRQNPHVAGALLRNGKERRQLQRYLNAQEDIEDIAVLAYDTAGAVVAYNRVAPRTSPLEDFDHRGDRWHVVERSTRSFLLYRENVQQNGNHIGDVVISRSLSTALPLSNRFLQSGGLAQALEEELGYEVVFDFTGSDPLRNDGRYLHIPFVAGNDTLGTAHVQKVIPAVQASRIAQYFDMATAFLFAVLLLVVSAPLHRRYARALTAGGYIAALTVHIWFVRYAFHYLDIAGALFPEPLLDPVHYASSFGWGIVSSPGGLFVTLLALCINASAAAYRLRRWRPHQDRNALYVPLLAITVLAQPFILRGFAAALRSFVADSGFNYDDIAPVFETPMLVLMYANTFLLAASAAAGVAASIAASARMLRVITPSRAKQAAFVFAAAVASVLLYRIATEELLLAFPVYLLYMLLFATAVTSSAQWPLLRRMSSARMAIIALVLMTATVSSLLSLFMNERRRAEVEAKAETLARSVDTWTKVQVEQSLVQIRAKGADDITGGRNEYRTAFRIWTATPLSLLQNNSAIILTEPDGEIISHFTAGIPREDLDEEYIAAVLVQRTEESIDVADTSTVESHAYYAGFVPVAEGLNDSLNVIVVVEAHDPFSQEDMSFDIIRYEERRRSLAPEDDLQYYEFTRGGMTRTSEPEVPKAAPLPAAVRDTLDKGANAVWAQMHFPSGERLVYFIRAGESPGRMVYGIAIGRPVPLYSAYRILRLGTIYAACMGLFFLAGAAVTRRRIVPNSPSFPVKLQLALLFVAAIPTVIVWITVRQIIDDNATEEHKQSVERSVRTLGANLPAHGEDTADYREQLERLTNADCFRLRSATGNDVNIYTGKRLVATSRPELYETSLLSGSLSPDAYLAITLEQRDFAVRREVIGDYPFYVGYAAARDPYGNLAGIISTPALFAPEITEQAYIYATASQYVWVAVIIILVLAASSLLARQIARPLRTLINATQTIAAGDLTRTVETRGSREIEELGASFNTMTARLRASQQDLAAAERELAWKEMAKQVAHEIRNPLTPMRLAAQHLRHAYKAGGDNIGELIMKVTDTILEQVEKLNRISAEFSRFARMPKRATETVDLADVIHETMRLFHHTEGVEMHFNVGDGPWEITADREELSSVFTNLLRNAVQAIQDEGEIFVALERKPGGISAEIRDTGAGIPDEVLPRIFEPSFSTKTDGMGLGLAIIKKILDDMNAPITIESEPGEGTAVRILFPAA